MPTVEAHIEIAAPLATVYETCKQVERFPEFMPDVQRITVLERESNRTKTEWVGVISKFNRTIRWTEEDEWDDEAHVCLFRMVEGDFHQYEGRWEFRDAGGDRTDVALTVTYDYRVPLLGPIIQGVLKGLVQRNCDDMLTAIKREVEK